MARDPDNMVTSGQIFRVITKDSWLGHENIGDFKDFGPAVVEEFSKHVGEYFDFKRQLYPERRHFTRITWPKSFRYFRIAQDDTEHMFPKDADIRHSIDVLRRVFVHNIWTWTLIKRFLLVAFFALMVMVLHALNDKGDDFGSSAVLVGVGGPAAAALALALLPDFIFYGDYRNRLSQSADSVGTLIVQRVAELRQLLSELQNAIDDRREDKIAEWSNEWAADAAFMTTLIIWVAKRMEYIEKYLQSEMWRITRTIGWCRIVGFFVAAASCAGLISYGLWIDPLLIHAKSAVHLAVFWSACAIMAGLSIGRLNTPSREIQKILESKVPRITEARLDEIVGRLVRKAEQRIMNLAHQNQDMSGRQSAKSRASPASANG